MILGRMRSESEAAITLAVRAESGAARSVEAIVDTGFDGFLSLSPDMVRSLGLIECAIVFAELANGQETLVRVFEAEVEWDGRARRIDVVESNGDPLLGMALLRGFHLGIDVIDGGRVAVRPLAE